MQHDYLCTFAAPGTYGHECGRKAVFVRSRPSEHTASGIFYARRCGECANIKGGENSGTSAPVPFDPVVHANKYPDRADILRRLFAEGC